MAKHLSETYGDRAFSVAKLAALTGKRWPIVGKRLHEEFPYIDAEVCSDVVSIIGSTKNKRFSEQVRYAVREYACTAVDVIARRLRLAFLNVQVRGLTLGNCPFHEAWFLIVLSQAAEEALPSIISIMAEELKWSEDEQKRQHAEAVKFVREEMGQQVNRQSRDKIPINLSREEISNYIKRFQALDHDKKGYISINDIRRGLKVCSCLYYIHQIIIYDKIPLTDWRKPMVSCNS